MPEVISTTLGTQPCRIRAEINDGDCPLSASLQFSTSPKAASLVVYKTLLYLRARYAHPSALEFRLGRLKAMVLRPIQATHSRRGTVWRSSSVSRTTTGKGIRDSGLQTASFILPAPDRTASPFGADSDWRTGMADMYAVHDAPRLIVLQHRVGVRRAA